MLWRIYSNLVVPPQNRSPLFRAEVIEKDGQTAAHLTNYSEVPSEQVARVRHYQGFFDLHRAGLHEDLP